METERDRYRLPWIEPRQIRCLMFAIIGPGIALGIFVAGLEAIYTLAAINSNQMRNPGLKYIAASWIDTQLAYTFAALIMLCILGFPFFVYCKFRFKDAASKCELIISICVAVALLALLPVIGEYFNHNGQKHYADALRTGLLFFVICASSGAWIAWQAWRSVHPEEKFWPRFSLATLLIVVIAWGALLAVFAP